MIDVFTKRFLKSVEKNDEKMIAHDLPHVIYCAIQNGDLEAIKNYINNFMKNKEQLYFKNSDGNSYFKIAVRYGNKEIIDYFISLNLHLHDNLKEVLEYAIKSKDVEIVKYILENKLGSLENESILKDLGDLLITAIANESLPIVGYLVELGADVNYLTGEVLNTATAIGNNEIIKYLVEHGANMRGDGYYSVAMVFIKNNFDILEYFIEKGLSSEELINFKDSQLSKLYEWVKKYNEMKDMNKKLELNLSLKDSQFKKKI